MIDQSKSGSVSVLGVTSGTALVHAADMFDDNDPSAYEQASVTLAELASQAPVSVGQISQLISDTHHLSSNDTKDFIAKSAQIGFVDFEGDGSNRLLFNGYLFKRDTLTKTRRVLDSLSSLERIALTEFDTLLRTNGSVAYPEALKILGPQLLGKVRAAALYDMNVVHNEAGDHIFVTSPGSFHKFSNPLAEDAFDHAKALVAALSYGMSVSPETRGRIWNVEALLSKLLRGETIGPAPAIGNDYRALELERVVQITRLGWNVTMRLLKLEVGQIALDVLQGRNASAAALENLPSAGMRAYTGPETSRVDFRRSQSPPSKLQTRSLLSAVRSGGSL